MVEGFGEKNILIVGLGLMGGSVAKALHRKGFINVFAVDKDDKVIARAQKEGVIKGGAADAGKFLPESDFVVVCLYPELAVKFINDNEANFKSGAVITDICGVKGPVVNKVTVKREDISFVPGHPMAGSERQGYECSFETLFDGCNYIVTPLEANSPQSVGMVETFAKTLGAKKIVKTTPKKHDELIAYTSQIPHALAVAYMHTANERDVLPFAGGSFRDVSRVALINEVMWTELFMQNKETLLKELKGLAENLNEIAGLIENSDNKKLEEYMKYGAGLKEKYDAENNS